MRNRPTSNQSDGGRKVKLVLAGLLMLGAAALLARQVFKRPEMGEFVRPDFERYAGKQLALIAAELCESAGAQRVGILSLFRDSAGPYAERLRTLESELQSAGITVGTYNAVSEGVYDDDDYSASIDAALAELSPQVLIVASVGGFTHARVTPAMQEFVAAGGRFLFAGQVFQTRSPVIDLIREGKAWALIKHTGALAPLAPQGRRLATEDPKAYFQSYYTVVKQENFAEIAALLR